jgi:hypothetical protein
MTPASFYARVLVPSAAALPLIDTRASRVLLMAIAGQESGWSARLQEPTPYARGFWQFEPSGIAGVIRDPLLAEFCAAYAITLSPAVLFEALAWNDLLAYAVARLTLWRDPAVLPAVGDVGGCWTYYLRCWRPGRPRLDDWAGVYRQTLVALS